jgi:hypothetical protein
MFRTSCVQHQEDYIIKCSLVWYVFHAFMQAVWQVEGRWLTLRTCITMHGTKRKHEVINGTSSMPDVNALSRHNLFHVAFSNPIT